MGIKRIMGHVTWKGLLRGRSVGVHLVTQGQMIPGNMAINAPSEGG